MFSKLGLEAYASGLPEDFVYNNVLKVAGIGGAALAYIPIVPPLLGAATAKKSKKA